MAKTPLFNTWTWKRSLPEPFDSLPDNVSTTYYSCYCTTAAKKSTLHSSALSAILAYMDMDAGLTPSPSESAIGTQDEKLIAEYRSRTGEIHAVIFNKKNRKFTASRFDGTSAQKVYTLKDSGNSGTALFFVLMPEALTDDEFSENYAILADCKKKGFPDMDRAASSAFILCDNLYRRIEGADTLGDHGIRVIIPSTGNIQQITALNLTKGAYTPTTVLYGTFQILTAAISKGPRTLMSKEEFVGKYALSERTFTPEEQALIPVLPDWYVLTPEVVTICEHAKKTSDSAQPMRNFMLRGPAGTGKTEDARAVAAGMGKPYLHYTCSANTEIYDLLGQMLPLTEGTDHIDAKYPSFEDIMMDPSSAYMQLTGIYDEEITAENVFEKMMEIMKEDAQNAAGKKEPGQRFQFVESPIVTGMKKGYVVEVQEPTVITMPGVLVGLNELLKYDAHCRQLNGEWFDRDKESIFIITTNTGYAGCRDMNQSIISRMNMIIDVEEPDANTLTERAMNITGCRDRDMVFQMASAVLDINERCRETMISDGSCGPRELYSWVMSYMVCGNVMEAARYTLLPSVSCDPENRADIQSTCLDVRFAA